MMSTDVEIRPYRCEDAASCESLIREAFWNVYRPGCHEHYLWHLAAQGHPDVVPELVLVAAVGAEVVGCVLSTRGRLEHDSGAVTTVVVPGPLAVLPGRQGEGIGARLMQETITRARAAGYPAAFLYGSPDYYPRFGFRDAAQFAVTTAEGDNFPAFMGAELAPGTLSGAPGRLVESSLFAVDDAAVEAFDAQFPPRVKERTATQL